MALERGLYSRMQETRIHGRRCGVPGSTLAVPKGDGLKKGAVRSSEVTELGTSDPVASGPAFPPLGMSAAVLLVELDSFGIEEQCGVSSVVFFGHDYQLPEDCL